MQHSTRSCLFATRSRLRLPAAPSRARRSCARASSSPRSERSHASTTKSTKRVRLRHEAASSPPCSPESAAQPASAPTSLARHTASKGNSAVPGSAHAPGPWTLHFVSSGSWFHSARHEFSNSSACSCRVWNRLPELTTLDVPPPPRAASLPCQPRSHRLQPRARSSNKLARGEVRGCGGAGWVGRWSSEGQALVGEPAPRPPAQLLCNPASRAEDSEAEYTCRHPPGQRCAPGAWGAAQR